MRHIAHADGRAVGLRNRHLAARREFGAVKELIRHARPQFDIGPKLVRILAGVGFVGERRKAPGPHLQARRHLVVGDADDALFVVVVDHAPEISALHVRRRIGDAHRRPVPEVAQSFETAPALARARIAAGQIGRPVRRAVGLRSAR